MTFKTVIDREEIQEEMEDLPDLKKPEDVSKQASLGKPPRPGLVPQTGDPRHPYRWVKESGIQDRKDLERMVAFKKAIVATPKVSKQISPEEFEKRKSMIIEWVERYRIPPHHLASVHTIQLSGRNVSTAGMHQGGKIWIYNNFNPDKLPAEMEETLIHELGHAVHVIGMTDDQFVETRIAYEKAVESDSGFPSTYAMTDFQEFVAECYAAFVFVPEMLKKRNYLMYDLMERVFAGEDDD